MWDLSPSTSPWETTHRESPGTPIPGYSYCIGLHGQKRCHCQAKRRAATAGPELRGPLVHGRPSPMRSASHCVDCPVSGWSQPLFSACAWSAPINPVSRGEKDTNTTQIQRTLGWGGCREQAFLDAAVRLGLGGSPWGGTWEQEQSRKCMWPVVQRVRSRG